MNIETSATCVGRCYRRGDIMPRDWQRCPNCGEPLTRLAYLVRMPAPRVRIERAIAVSPLVVSSFAEGN